MKSYYIISGTDRTSWGPFEESAVSEAYTHGEYPPNTLVWTEGMPGWVPIAEVFASPANVPSPDSKLPAPPSVSGLAGTDSHSSSCAYSNPFKALRYVCLHCTYQGRATRKEYWMAMLGLFLISLIIGFLIELLSVASLTVSSYIALAVFQPLALFIGIGIGLPLQCRRLHDIGRSGWWLMIWWCVPCIVDIALLILSCQDSQSGVIWRVPGIGDCIALLVYIALLILSCQDSQRGTNKYGPSEKYPD